MAFNYDDAYHFALDPFADQSVCNNHEFLHDFNTTTHRGTLIVSVCDIHGDTITVSLSDTLFDRQQRNGISAQKLLAAHVAISTANDVAYIELSASTIIPANYDHDSQSYYLEVSLILPPADELHHHFMTMNIRSPMNSAKPLWTFDPVRTAILRRHDLCPNTPLASPSNKATESPGPSTLRQRTNWSLTSAPHRPPCV